MHPVIPKTFGGLSTSYYFRQFIFGLIFPLIIYVATKDGTHSPPLPILLILPINTLLYPYSRFVYESVMGFLVGENIFVMNAILMLGFKLMSMAFCWTFAIMISPIGLIYLYFHHSKVQR